MDTGVGFQNLLFFIGVVENNEDRRLEGRVQVRAFGIHGTVDDIPTEELPWATLIIGSHDTNFVVPPLNSWVFGFFLDGRDAQQPMIIGLIPTQMLDPIDPQKNGWGMPLGNDMDRGAMSKRHQDFGQPMLSRLARGENLEETYNLALETNRRKDIEIAGGGAYVNSMGNRNHWGGDTEDQSPYTISGTTADRIAALDNDPEFQKELDAFTRKHGVTREEVYGIMAGESNYTPNTVNDYGYAGLFQFGDKALFDINQINGTSYTPTSIAASSPAEQLHVYDLYLDRWSFENSSGLGVMQGAPRYGSSSGDTIVHEEGSLAWQRNPGWRGPDGQITVDSMNAYYNRSNPPPLGPDETANTTTDFVSTAESPEELEAVHVSAPAKTTAWSEPESGYMATYPYNRVIETAGGHVIEVDSTQGSERIMVWHPSGSYMQMTRSSNTVKSTKDFYGIHDQNHHVYIGGKNMVTIEGDSHVLVKGNKIEEIRGDYKQIVHGNIDVGSAGQVVMNGGEEVQIRAARLDLESNVENLNLNVGKKIVITSGEEMHFKSKNVFMEAIESFNTKAGIDINTRATGNVNTKGANAYVEAENAFNLKGENVRIGGDSKISISAALVGIDDVVRMAEGVADAASSIQKEAVAAENATVVEMETPPNKSTNLKDLPEKTGEQNKVSSSTSTPIGAYEDRSNDVQGVDVISVEEGGDILVKDSTGYIRTLTEGQRLAGTDFTVSSVDYENQEIALSDSANNIQTLRARA